MYFITLTHVHGVSMNNVTMAAAFATFRNVVIEELKVDVSEELLPNWKAEAEDIRRTHEELRATKGDAVADNHKKARVMDLQVRRNMFLDGLNSELQTRMHGRVKDYNGVTTTVKVADPKHDGEMKDVQEVKFPDGSTARVPQRLWIDLNLFERI